MGTSYLPADCLIISGFAEALPAVIPPEFSYELRMSVKRMVSMLCPELNQKKKIVSYLAGLPFLILFAMFFLAPGDAAASSDVDRLVAELKRPDWQDSLAMPGWVARFKNDQSYDTLTDLISNKGINWRIRIRAIRLLGATGNTRGINFLADILNDPFLNNDCPAIKWNTITALGNFKKDQTVIDTLLYSLRFEDNIVVREVLIETLGKVGDARVVPFLIPVLNDKSFAIRRSAIEAIGALGGREAAPFLKRLSDYDGDPYIRNEALSSLKKIDRRERS